ncbi:MAG: hypothetical protein K8I30_10550 [Anaerolineae bacterium]|nr:hypothetical protein [Anaerolineae bacterium]
MRHKITSGFLILTGGLLMLVGAALLALPQPVLADPILTDPLLAQCGSQASSCKSCHEVKAEMPVNNDGTGWHESHAFGDFCIMCHAGNEQSMVAEEAHFGMVPPLSDIDAACKMCHTDDLQERAEVYAIALGIDLSSGGASPDQAAPTSAPPADATPAAEEPAAQEPEISAPVSEAAPVSVPADNELVVDDPNIVDYVQRYNEIVLGERPVNWGNIILIGLIGLVIVGGGGFMIFNELRIRTATKAVEGGYPAEVVEMLPAIAGLKTQSRKSLRNILNHPRQTDKVLSAVETLITDEKLEE